MAVMKMATVMIFLGTNTVVNAVPMVEDYSCSFQGSSELIRFTVTVSLVF